MHSHENDEILSYIRKGEMTHEDDKNKGNLITINNTHLMMMNAGKGVFHEETVPKDGEDVEMLQIFMRAEKDNVSPNVQFHDFNKVYSDNNWRLIAGFKTSEAPLTINSKVRVFDNHITKNSLLNVVPGKTGFLYIFNGEININKDLTLRKGDSIVTDENLEIELINYLFLFEI